MRGVLAAVCVAALLAAARAGPTANKSLAGSLGQALFYNGDTVRSEDQFIYVPMSVSYMEPDNVTCSSCTWAGHTWSYLWKVAPPPNASGPETHRIATAVRSLEACNTSAIAKDTDLPGADMGESPAPATLEACQALCCTTLRCEAYVFEPATDATMGGCRPGKPCCFLKSAVPPGKPKQLPGGVFSGSVTKPQASVTAPPMGIRSSPPLGGVGAGSVELRGDGSFREWTILNQGPAGSGKFGLVDDAWLAVRRGGVARALRTHPPAGVPGVDALRFSGSYPMTRLAVLDDTLTAAGSVGLTVHAYSTLRPTDMEASAFPAVLFTLTVNNTSPEPQDVEFQLSIPLGAWTDCARTGDGKATPGGGGGPGAPTPAGCMAACAQSPDCASWQLDTATGACRLNADVPLTHHAVGSYCGVRNSGWRADPTTGAITLEQRPLASGPSMGDLTIMASQLPGQTARALTGNSSAQLLGALGQGRGSRGAPVVASAALGAQAVGASVAPHSVTTLTLALAWHFPDRDYSGEILGNGYANLWGSSTEVAAELAEPAKVVAVVDDINRHHSAVAHPSNPAPEWLKDMLLNQFSHVHMLMWFRDGRMREYEAFSCSDVDSVHNDYQRHLLYMWLFPEFERSKMRAWSTFAQAADGHIVESLAPGPGRPMDQPSGRLMGDTTTLYCLEAAEMFFNSGDADSLRALWPSIRNATAWMIANAMQNNSFGVPQYLQTTYDHFGFNRQQAVVYNANVYMTALAAVQELAGVVGDAGVRASASAALALAQKRTVAVFWNATLGYFRATTSGNQVFTDSLYGQMLAHHALGNFTLDANLLRSHLDYEWHANQDTYGMRVLSNPIQEDSIWMNGPPTWSYLELVLQANRTRAWEPLRRMSENFRTRLNDQWNLRALTHTQTEGTSLEHGCPREQGHYAFMLTDLFLYPLLSGQHNRVDRGLLRLDPPDPPPYVLPVMLMNCEATVAVAADKAVTFTVVFGHLQLPAGGLVVLGKPYPGAVALTSGQSISW